MKILSNFITNSSSSSFVVFVKGKEGFNYNLLPDGIKAFFEILFGKPISTRDGLIKSVYEECIGGDNLSVEEMLGKLREELEEDEYKKNILEKSLSKIEQGDIVFSFDLDWSDSLDTIQRGLKKLQEEGLIEIILES